MRRLLLIALAASLLAAPAQAHRTTSRVHVMRDIAVALYGPDVCGNTMAVRIQRGPMLQPQWLAYAHYDDTPPPYTGCIIVLKDTRWETEYLCRVIQHEYKHLTGWRAPPGEAYVGADGVPDPAHSNDPLDLMWPFVISTFAPCANGAADALPRS